jgi:LCP family protein required for cell wall assembly
VGGGRHSRRLPRRRTVLKVTAIAVSSVLVLSALAVVLVYFKLDGNFTRKSIEAALGRNRPPVTRGDSQYPPLNIVLIGSDSRAAGNSKYGVVDGARSDTTILLHISGDRKSAIGMSIPRDSVVNIPSCQKEDGTTTPAQFGMFNAAYELAGTACTVKTIEQNTQIRVDNYAVVDFQGFKGIVDALGGVDVCLPTAIDDKKSKLRLPAGRQTVQGEDALAYVRVRYSSSLGNGSDLGRIDRQQKFLSAMVQKAKSAQVLLNPIKLIRFLNAATQSVTTDFGSLNDMRKVAQSLNGIDTRNVRFLTVPNQPYPADTNRVEWVPDTSEALFEAIRTDQPLPGTAPPSASARPTASTPPLTTPPSKITVRVLNGSGTPGVGTKAAAALRTQGFTVNEVANADRSDYPTSEVRYPASYDQSGRTLTAAIPGARAVVDSTVQSTLVVVIGRNFTTVRPVTVSGTASASPSPKLESRSAVQNICG